MFGRSQCDINEQIKIERSWLACRWCRDDTFKGMSRQSQMRYSEVGDMISSFGEMSLWKFSWRPEAGVFKDSDYIWI